MRENSLQTWMPAARRLLDPRPQRRAAQALIRQDPAQVLGPRHAGPIPVIRHRAQLHFRRHPPSQFRQGRAEAHRLDHRRQSVAEHHANALAQLRRRRLGRQGVPRRDAVEHHGALVLRLPTRNQLPAHRGGHPVRGDQHIHLELGLTLEVQQHTAGRFPDAAQRVAPADLVFQTAGQDFPQRLAVGAEVALRRVAVLRRWPPMRRFAFRPGAQLRIDETIVAAQRAALPEQLELPRRQGLPQCLLAVAVDAQPITLPAAVGRMVAFKQCGGDAGARQALGQAQPAQASADDANA